jgi:hypothetical protein
MNKKLMYFDVIYFFIYAMILGNLYAWLVFPEFLYTMLWKWDIFYTALMAPLLFKTLKY